MPEQMFCGILSGVACPKSHTIDLTDSCPLLPSYLNYNYPVASRHGLCGLLLEQD